MHHIVRDPRIMYKLSKDKPQALKEKEIDDMN
jgi:hypothetical protein